MGKKKEMMSSDTFSLLERSEKSVSESIREGEVRLLYSLPSSLSLSSLLDEPLTGLLLEASNLVRVLHIPIDGPSRNTPR